MTDPKERGLSRALMGDGPILVMLDVMVDAIREGRSPARAAQDRRTALVHYTRLRRRLNAARARHLSR